jgi:hypothetical protein
MGNESNMDNINEIISILSRKNSGADEEIENIIKDKTQMTIINTLLIYLIKKNIDKDEIEYVIDNCIQSIKKKMLSDCHSRAIAEDIKIDSEEFTILLKNCMDDIRDDMNSLLLQ